MHPSDITDPTNCFLDLMRDQPFCPAGNKFPIPQKTQSRGCIRRSFRCFGVPWYWQIPTENLIVFVIISWPLIVYYSACKVTAVLWNCQLKILCMHVCFMIRTAVFVGLCRESFKFPAVPDIIFRLYSITFSRSVQTASSQLSVRQFPELFQWLHCGRTSKYMRKRWSPAQHYCRVAMPLTICSRRNYFE